MKIKKLLFIHFCIIISIQLGKSQSYLNNHSVFIPIETDQKRIIDNFFIGEPHKKFHASFQPFLKSVILNDNDSLKHKLLLFSGFNKKATIHLFDESKTNIKINIAPQIHSEIGFDALKNNTTFFQSGGIKIESSIGTKFYLRSEYLAGIFREPNFTDTLISETKVLQGLGIAYLHSKENSYSFQNFNGYLSFSPKAFVNFQLGKDKLFLGDGYRSLLLSDVAVNYPFFKTSFQFLNFQYNVWYSWFNNIQDAYGLRSSFKNKYGTFHYLSWNATKNISVSFFENVIFQGTDTTRSRGFDSNYLNPVIFFRPVEYSLGSSDNSMMGLNFSIRFLKKFKWYNQLVLDEFYLKEIRARKGWWANKQGIQTGIKHINTFGIKNLTTQLEYNWVRPYTYSHGSPDQSYTHFNQPLAHPFGANFKETIFITAYNKKNFSVSSKFIYAIIGKDSTRNSNVGQNLFLSYTTRNNEYGNYTGQGKTTTFLHAELKFAYLILPEYNLKLEAAFIQRVLKNENGLDKRTPFIYFAIKTNLVNFYRDF
jgi:hypothetical protein